MRIGIFGGTFDPPHEGHLALAEAARTALALDEVVWVPARRNPHKTRPLLAGGADRMEMIRLLIGDREGHSVSDVELTRDGPSYAVDTMTEFAHARPAEYWFLLGTDALEGLPTWKQPERLLRLCRLAVVGRGSDRVKDLIAQLPEFVRDRIDLVAMPAHPASSTTTRDHLARGLAPRHLPPAVLDFISERRLYPPVIAPDP
jgi:nicotinate-nucleotide adenylyltransferase